MDCYRHANRLAVLDFLLERGVEADLVDIDFTGETKSDTPSPADRASWEPTIAAMKQHLGPRGDSRLEQRPREVFIELSGQLTSQVAARALAPVTARTAPLSTDRRTARSTSATQTPRALQTNSSCGAGPTGSPSAATSMLIEVPNRLQSPNGWCATASSGSHVLPPGICLRNDSLSSETGSIS